MTWCLGCLVLYSLAASQQGRGEVLGLGYFTAVAFWALVGLGALTVSVVRLVSGKIGAGAPGPLRVPRPGAPAEKREG